MHKWWMFLVAACSATVTLAQTPISSPLPEESSLEQSREQRRMELRTALSASRQPESTLAPPDASPVGHQLSSRERAEMREQLRRYQPGVQHRRRP